MIESTVAKVKDGLLIVNEVGRSFSSVVSSSDKVKELITRIAAASAEQADG